MKLTVFPSDKGDCLLLTGADDRRVLVDGGMATSYERYVAPALAELAAQGEELEAVCVTHVDEDHISGILRLMDDLLAWRVYDYRLQSDEADDDPPKTPKTPRPPKVKKIWHNAFSDQLQDNAEQIEATLAATATVLTGLPNTAAEGLRVDALRLQDLAASTGQAIRLSQRVGPAQLGINVNPEYDHGLMLARPGNRPLQVGGMKITVVGPSDSALEDLRQEWNEWLEKNQKVVTRLRERARKDERSMLETEVDRLRAQMEDQAVELSERGQVTVPNLASLVLLVEQGDRSILLTGDARDREILEGLEAAKKVDESGRLHVDVLKVQHHGSENNVDPEFCRRITADHYVFCADGAHENPDLGVVEMLIASRLGAGEDRATHPRAVDRPFTFWFNSSSTFGADPTAQDGERGSGHARSDRRKHMAKVEKLVRQAARQSRRRMKVKFITDRPFAGASRFELDLGAAPTDENQ